MKQELILIKVGEIALKGLNRRTFEDVLMKNIKRHLAPLGKFEVRSAQSTIYVRPLEEDVDLDDACERVGKVFGIAAYSRACMAKKDMDDINRTAAEYLKEALEEASTFKVEAKRSDKAFPLKSPAICAETGGYLLERFPNLSVDVHEPDITVTVEIRDFGAYVRGEAERGAGGIPVGTGGKAAVLISGGIDSPVAAWMMAKRGVELTAVHFASPPYTSERARDKVVDLAKIVSEYTRGIRLYVVPFTDIQLSIIDNCPKNYLTIIMRRIMMRIAEKIAVRNGDMALVTGESVGQVASQTMEALYCTDAAVNMPVFRPCIGMDKEEIVTISKKIDAFETSIQPYEDCCTVFTPKHPRTRPVLKFVELAESGVEWEEMLREAADQAVMTKIGYAKE